MYRLPMRLRHISRLFKITLLTFVVCLFLLIWWAVNHSSHAHSLEKGILSSFYARDRVVKMRIRQNGNFWILQNYIRATKEFDYLDSITYTTHGEFTYLENVEELVRRWRGPISLAIFAPDLDFSMTLRSIDYLHRCSHERRLIRELVSFHVYFPSDHMPAFIPKDDFARFSVQCVEPPPFTVDPNSTYRHNKTIPYPINVSRNIARQSAATYFIFPSDIEMYPNMNFIEDFFDLVRRKPEFLFAKRRVYVLAVFEVDKTETIPNTKTDLQEMLYMEKAIPFHMSFCLRCHAIPYLDKWIAQKESAQLDIFSVGKHHPAWEPFYVTTNNEPLYDERYTWEGRYDKQIQADVLGLLNYDFYTLNNAFLVHRPGIKQYSLPNYTAVAQINRRTADEIVPQLRILYG